jgi:hypothetical protein
MGQRTEIDRTLPEPEDEFEAFVARMFLSDMRTDSSEPRSHFPEASVDHTEARNCPTRRARAPTTRSVWLTND